MEILQDSQSPTTEDEGYETEGVGEYILELFGDHKGVCVDVGAYHSRWLSNSYLLEKNDWVVYCIEPNPYCQELLAERKHVYQYAIGPENQDNVDFYIFDVGHGPDGRAGGTSLKPHKGLPREDTKVDMRTLDWFLTHETKVDIVDFLSIDVEGSEMEVLQSIGLDFWRVKVICIENIDEGVTDQMEYLTGKNYTKTERFMYNDIYERF
jgi:FkbM family methyltransferase